MSIHQLVDEAIADAVASLWPAFAPELVLCGTIFAILILRVFRWGELIDAFLITLVGSAVALYYASPWESLAGTGDIARQELFTRMLVLDGFTVYLRAILLLFAILFAIFTKVSGMPDREASPDFYGLVLGATLGMCLMASANHLLMVFLAVEMASVPSYVLAATLKGRRKSSEAALKYAVYGAGAAGVMLYGISLLAGVTNTAHLPTLANELAVNWGAYTNEQFTILALGGLMLMVGLAFKLSAVPFHFWCPDVFEGATAEVNAFLSVASKAAALALLVRVAVGFGYVPESIPSSVDSDLQTEEVALDVAKQTPVILAADSVAVAEESDLPLEESSSSSGSTNETLSAVRNFTAMLIAFIATITCTFGNLAAYAQTNIKRLMAYSTIAHAGYMMLPVPAALAVAGIDNESARAAIASIALYIAIYLFMNLGAFAIIAYLRNTLHTEEISDYAGLIRKAPGVVICLGAILFSLIGIPPLAGFVAKFAIFASLADSYRLTGHAYLIALLVVGGVNTVISLFYYLRVIKVMTIDPEPQDALPGQTTLLSLQGAYIVVITIPVLLLIINWDTLNSWTQAATQQMF